MRDYQIVERFGYVFEGKFVNDGGRDRDDPRLHFRPN
jgi:hypothetical protein